MGQHPPDRTVLIDSSSEPNLLVRAVWFLAVGWWLSLVVTFVAILLQWTIIGIPLAVWLINRMPQVVTLKSSRHLLVSTEEAGVTTVRRADRPRHPFWIRALYFVLVGWWAVAIWLFVAWFLVLTILGLPLAFWMYGATGKVQTLRE